MGDGEPLVDALQTMASLRLSQESRHAKAVPYILCTYDKMIFGIWLVVVHSLLRAPQWLSWPFSIHRGRSMEMLVDIKNALQQDGND